GKRPQKFLESQLKPNQLKEYGHSYLGNERFTSYMALIRYKGALMQAPLRPHTNQQLQQLL
ncbi:hypothetical protein M8C21_033407, partial [Ambrosia artemisiifolia]